MNQLLIFVKIKMLNGYFRDNKCPLTTIIVVGTKGEEEVEAIVDTGFNGYLTIPHFIARRVGMEFTNAISSSSIADGSSSPSLIYTGKIVYDNSRIDILFDVQENCKVLLGTALLEELGLTLFVDVTARRVEFNKTGTLTRPV